MNHPRLPISHPTLRDYIPLMIVFAAIIAATLLVCIFAGYSLDHLLGYSMGFFFVVFGAFKLADLRMFAMGYREYDIIAKNLPAWGYIYPFIEFALGALFLFGWADRRVLWLTILLSAVTVTSVWLKLRRHETIHCVCLGNLLKVPLTYVSLVEYAAMGAMAVAMLAL